MKKRRSTLILIILLPFIPVIMYATKIGKTLEYKTIDWRFRVRGESLVSENVFIAAMDDYSIDLIGRWPWRRGIIGSFINTLSVLPPQQMVLDILYTETSADFPIDDRLLAGASARNGRVYFPFLSLLGAPVFGIESLDDMLDPVKEIMLKSSLGKVEDYPEVDFIDAQTVLPPISQFAQVAKNSGYVNSEPDSDGVNRRIPLLMKMDGYIFPYLGLSAALDYLDADRNSLNIKPGSYIEFSLPEGTIKIPVDQEMRMLVNQRGRFSPKSLNMASFRGMFEYMDGLSRGGESDSLYKDFTESILFLGLTGTGTSDLGVTPFESSCPMVGYLATSAANIIEKDFLREVPDYLNILLILLFGFLASGITGGRPAHHAALLNILVLLILTISSLAAFKANIVFSLFYPAAAVAISYGGVTAYRFTMEEKEKKAIRGMFSRYVSSQIVDELMKNPETVQLGGSRKRLTVFFSDIRGFSSMAENLDPEEVVQILNEYLTEMIDIIFKHRGTLDKFMGDAIMAIWGAPVDEEEHAKFAVRAAWEMMNKLMELQKKWVQEGKKPISVGMGINTGEMVIGNMGSVQFSDYTVIGDNVNLAARLEQNAAAGQLIISKATYEEVKDIVEVRQLEPLMVKGKEKPQEVYEVVNVFA